jgi:hypothetical protein
VTFYSSDPWTRTIVDGKSVFLGLWGHTATYFQPKTNIGGRLYIVGGQYGQAGPFSSASLVSREGLFCDQLGVACGGKYVFSNLLYCIILFC